MNATLEFIEKLTPAVQTFWFRPEKPLRYIAGQFTELYLPHIHPDSRGERRWFTLSSAPGKELISITTEFTAKGGSSFKHALQNAPIGTIVQLSEPMGDFVLPKDRRIPLTFVAGGLGITPVHSIVSYLQTRHEQRQVVILHGVRTERQLLFRTLFTSCELSYQPCITSKQGRLTAKQILGISNQPHLNGLFYLSGPENMVYLLAADLRAHGVPNSQLIIDTFPGYRQV